MSDTYCTHGVLIDATNPDMASRCYDCEPVTNEEFHAFEVARRGLERERNDWRRSAQVAWMELTNLKYRVAGLRNYLRSSAMQACLDSDDARRRRFERRLKKENF